MEKIDDIKAYLKEHENKQLLRFITCGNVDDGKSTLIGRLLHDSKGIFDDQLENIKKDSMVLDLGTGTGIIPILLCGKTKLKKVTGIELQEEVAKMAKKSIKLNNLEDKFNVINENILK